MIELLVAMAIIGVMLVPMVNAYTFSMKSLRHSKNRQLAAMLGKDCLAKLRSTVPFSALPTGGSSIKCDGSAPGGDPYSFPEPNADFEYETQVSDINTSGGPSMRLVRIRVRFPTPFHTAGSCVSGPACSAWDFTTLMAER